MTLKPSAWIKTSSWQANDPLVHNHYEDLLIFPTNTISQAVIPPNAPVPTNFSIATAGRLNHRYTPWGSNPDVDPTSDPNAYLLAVKDPGVRASDDWNFPRSEPLSFSVLGRIHRGTPWQTIYLKSAVASKQSWIRQSLDPNTHPTNDWAIATLLGALLNPAHPRQLFSANETNVARWASFFSGVTALSNNVPDTSLRTGPYSVEAFQMTSNSPQATIIAEGINRFRTQTIPGGFESLGNILRVPELTTASPWLNLNTNQIRFGLTDIPFEILPQQILSRLRADLIGSIREEKGVAVIRFSAFPDQHHVLQRSTDLRHWETVSAQTISSNTFKFTVPAANALGGQFYRLFVP